MIHRLCPFCGDQVFDADMPGVVYDAPVVTHPVSDCPLGGMHISAKQWDKRYDGEKVKSMIDGGIVTTKEWAALSAKSRYQINAVFDRLFRTVLHYANGGIGAEMAKETLESVVKP